MKSKRVTLNVQVIYFAKLVVNIHFFAELIVDRTAQELAYLEKPARDREAELKRQEQTGLTKEQEGNVAILEGLQE